MLAVLSVFANRKIQKLVSGFFVKFRKYLDYDKRRVDLILEHGLEDILAVVVCGYHKFTSRML